MLFVALISAAFLSLAAGQQCNQRFHGSFGNSRYYYSWRENPGLQVGANQARNFCRQRCMDLVGLESGAESSFVRNLVAQERLQFIWTSGVRRGNGWVWANSGVGFPPRGQAAWSNTGGAGRPQPDNREGNENCMAILNFFYNDGVVWHDVGCSHRKPFICESNGGGGGGGQGRGRPAGRFFRNVRG